MTKAKYCVNGSDLLKGFYVKVAFHVSLQRYHCILALRVFLLYNFTLFVVGKMTKIIPRMTSEAQRTGLSHLDRRVLVAHLQPMPLLFLDMYPTY